METLKTKPDAGRGAALAAMAVALVAVLLTQYPGALRVPFINDDYVFLDRVRDAPFASLWGFDRLFFHWYRPWSRELHYWVISGAFGPTETPFHVVSLALWLTIHLLYFLLVDRIAGRRAAAVATAGLALLAAWAVPVLWIAAVQDLWMLAFSLLALNALARGRTVAAAIATALALLSKETAATLPAIGLLLLAIAARRSWRDALRDVLPMGAVVVAWAFVHPLLGGRLWHGAVATPPVAAAAGEAPVALRTLLSMVNLDRIPAPVTGWPAAIALAAPAAIALALAVAWSMRRAGVDPARDARRRAEDVAASQDRNPATRAIGFGAAWAALGWLPLALPGLGWHAYYAIAGAFGAWLALGVLLSRHRAIALTAIVAIATLRAAAAATPSFDWGTEWYQRRAASFQEFMRDDLKRRLPRPPPRARLFFTGVPSHVGFLTEGAPALRVWYRDTTLSGGFLTAYTPRRDGRFGDDRFFRYDSSAGWHELSPGAAVAGRAADPAVARDARDLAAAFAAAGEWRRAAIEYEAIALLPDSVEAALDAGVSRAMSADTAAAREWFTKALNSPRSSTSQRAAASQYLQELGGGPH